MATLSLFISFCFLASWIALLTAPWHPQNPQTCGSTHLWPSPPQFWGDATFLDLRPRGPRNRIHRNILQRLGGRVCCLRQRGSPRQRRKRQRQLRQRHRQRSVKNGVFISHYCTLIPFSLIRQNPISRKARAADQAANLRSKKKPAAVVAITTHHHMRIQC